LRVCKLCGEPFSGDPEFREHLEAEHNISCPNESEYDDKYAH